MNIKNIFKGSLKGKRKLFLALVMSTSLLCGSILPMTQSKSFAAPKVISGWFKSEGYWKYRFMNNKYASNGWVYINNVWYYFDSNGNMLSNQWLYDNGKWYYLNPNGSLRTGWLKYRDNWYFFAQGGAMIHDTWTLKDNRWYYFDDFGKLHYGWFNKDGHYYYSDQNGVMMINRSAEIDGISYQFDNSGRPYDSRYINTESDIINLKPENVESIDLVYNFNTLNNYSIPKNRFPYVVGELNKIRLATVEGKIESTKDSATLKIKIKDREKPMFIEVKNGYVYINKVTFKNTAPNQEKLFNNLKALFLQ